jgi:hypothetical protein
MKKIGRLLALAVLTPSINTTAVEVCDNRGKRGLAFGKSANDPVNRKRPGAEYTQYFNGYSQITWMYDWEGIIDGHAIDLEYVPMLHDDQDMFTSAWADAVAFARQNYRTKHILSFNEPDQCR